MKLNKVDAVVLLLNAAAFLAFAVQWFFMPVKMAHGLGIELTSADAITDAQAVYGGLELGAGSFLAVCGLRAEMQRTGLLAALMMLSGLGVCRVLGIAMAATPVTGATWELVVTDFVGIALNAVMLGLSVRRARVG